MFPQSGASDASLEDVDSFQPVDVDLNMVQNLLQALQGEDGAAAGPAQTLLRNISGKDNSKDKLEE